MNILGISRSLKNETYLDLPLMLRRSRTHEFRYIREKLWSRIQGLGWEDALSRWKRYYDISSVASNPSLCHELF